MSRRSRRTRRRARAKRSRGRFVPPITTRARRGVPFYVRAMSMLSALDDVMCAQARAREIAGLPRWRVAP